MAGRYLLWGHLQFTTSGDLAAWEQAPVDARGYDDWNELFDGTPTDQVTTVDAILSRLEESVSADNQECYFLDVDCSATCVELRGYLHADDVDRQLFAAFRGAAEFGAEGSVYCENAIAEDERYRIRLQRGASTFELLDAAEEPAPIETVTAILGEAMRRARAT